MKPGPNAKDNHPVPQRPRILVVYKKSAFQLYTERKEPKVRALIARGARQNT